MAKEKTKTEIEQTITLIRACRWIFLRLAFVIFLVRAIASFTERNILSGVLNACIAVAIAAADLGLLGNLIRKLKKEYETAPSTHEQKNGQSNPSLTSPSDSASSSNSGMQRYKVEWVWDSACEVYCARNNKDPEELSEDENDEIYDLAGNDVALLLTWIVLHDFFVADTDLTKEYVNDLKNRKCTGSDFLCNVCDYKLARHDFSEKIIGFIDDYFKHDGPHTCGNFAEDYEAFIRNDLKKELYTVPFSWEEYEGFTSYIEKAYRKFSE